MIYNYIKKYIYNIIIEANNANNILVSSFLSLIITKMSSTDMDGDLSLPIDFRDTFFSSTTIKRYFVRVNVY